MDINILFFIGRIFFGGYFVMNGLNHFVFARAGLVGYAKSKQVPMPELAVFGSGLLILAGGLGILLGVYVEWAVLCLVLFLIPVTLKMHDFWNAKEPMQKMMEMVQFTKNMALIGAALMMLAISAPWPYSLGW